MLKVKIAAFFLFLLPLLGRAQTPAETGFRSVQALKDSMRVLQRYAAGRQSAAVERLSTQLLATYFDGYRSSFYYPPAWPGRPYTTAVGDFNYRPLAYANRGAARQQLGNFAGAEADYTLVIEYLTDLYAEQAGLLATGTSIQALLCQAYYERAELRRRHLANPAGSCADLAAGYELDAHPSDSVVWRGCPVPRSQAPRTPDEARQAQQARADTLARVERLLATGRLTQAEGLLERVENGYVGRFAWVRPPAQQKVQFLDPRYLRSELARRRGQYAQAQTVLADLLKQSRYDPLPQHRYALGTLKIDHLNDQKGGCADIYWALKHRTDTVSWRPGWHGCPPPRYRSPDNMKEQYQHKEMYQDSVKRAQRLLAAGQPGPAVSLLTQLLNTAQAGPYGDDSDSRYYVRLPDEHPSSLLYGLQIEARDTRARAYVALANYPRAKADLDTIVGYFRSGFAGSDYAEYYCRRGYLKADFLNDPQGACQDLEKCALYTPRGSQREPNPWRGCRPPDQAFGYRVIRPNIFSAFGSNYSSALRLGYLRQGALQGGEISLFRSHEQEAGDKDRGPSVGLEILGGPGFFLGPKVSYEAHSFPFGTRLDLAYYLGNLSGNRDRAISGDLRLTPQVGLSIFNLFHAFYGYAIPLAGTQAAALGYHRLSISINFLPINF